MSLASGSRFGSFEIVSPLGAGGMGEVYLARDTRLDRQVAIKVLLDSFATDPDRLARFEREAKLLASLNHPHIAQIYGLEESGSTRALVMELVDGPTLADRLTFGPVPLDDALAIARQIADALEAAHARGIVHRDLKPANVKLAADGTVKVLDFGLAKAVDAGSSIGHGAAAVSMSPTMTSPAMTRTGMILGTAAYMSPEQAKGREVDERADIWAFGVVCWEMVNGRALFARESLSETLAALLKEEPAWDRVPRSLRSLLEMCLAKDVKQRLRNAGDVRLLLDQRLDEDATRPLEAPPARRTARWPVAAAAALAAILGGLTVWMLTQPKPDGPMYLAVPHPGGESIGGNDFDDNMALSPDGRLVAYVTGNLALSSNTLRLYVRALDEPAPRLLSNSARTPFFSPDGQTIGFVQSNQRISRVPVGGGAPAAIGGDANGTRGASWGDDGIVFATADLTTGLMKISPVDGQLTELTHPDAAKKEMDHVFPDILPGGRGVLFTILTNTNASEEARVAVFDARTKTYKTLIERGSHPRFVAPGFLVFGSNGSLRAVAFDLDRLEVRGTPVPVMEGVASKPSGSVPFAVSRNGTLAYFAGAGVAPKRSFVWAGAGGRQEAAGPESGIYDSPAVSPDGSQVAVSVEGAGGTEVDIWVWSATSRTFSRLTFEAGVEVSSIWTPDGKRLVYESLGDAGGANLMSRPADGTGAPEALLERDPQRLRVIPAGWTPDGRLVFQDRFNGGESRIAVLSPGSKVSIVMSEAKYRIGGSSVSPDGRWLAYVSTESGSARAYVRPFPNVNGGKWQVSTFGATVTKWSRDGRLLYVGGNSGLMVGKVTATSSFAISDLAPAVGESVGAISDFAVGPDGRLLIVKTEEAPPVSSLNIVPNWATRLPGLVKAD